jgi:pilus assembly protein CpaB
VSARARRRRGLLLLALALVAGGLAASQVSGRVSAVERQVGRPVPVVVARQDIPPDTALDPKRLRTLLAVAQVPERFASPDSVATVEELAGRRTAVPVAAGSQLTLGQLSGGEERQGRPVAGPRGGERAVEVAVAGGDALGEAQRPGARVDVLVSTEPREGPGRTLLALENVELLGLRSGGGAGGPGGGGADGAASRASATATLRVSLRQAVYLTAAQNFAREVRLLARPPGDRRRGGRQAFSAAGL